MDVSCQCGAIMFKTPLPQPLAVYICHCDECRRQSSSAFGCSAIFPKFQLPSRDLLSLYSRPTASGNTLNCYFCKGCGTRLIHTTPGKDVVSVKGGCIEGLDWNSARHIWCKRAMVPIPEGVERDDEEPKEEPHGTMVSDVMSMMSGSGGSSDDEEKRREKIQGKAREYNSVPIHEESQRLDDIFGRSLISQGRSDVGRSLTDQRRETPERSIFDQERSNIGSNFNNGGGENSFHTLTLNSSEPARSIWSGPKDRDSASEITTERGRHRDLQKELECERAKRWEREVDIEVLKISLEASIERQQRELEKIRDFPKDSSLNSWGTLDSGATSTLTTMLERRLKQLAQEKRPLAH